MEDNLKVIGKKLSDLAAKTSETTATTAKVNEILAALEAKKNFTGTGIAALSKLSTEISKAKDFITNATNSMESAEHFMDELSEVDVDRDFPLGGLLTCTPFLVVFFPRDSGF
jgi:maltose-binding protein MalE